MMNPFLNNTNLFSLPPETLMMEHCGSNCKPWEFKQNNWGGGGKCEEAIISKPHEMRDRHKEIKTIQKSRNPTDQWLHWLTKAVISNVLLDY